MPCRPLHGGEAGSETPTGRKFLVRFVVWSNNRPVRKLEYQRLWSRLHDSPPSTRVKPGRHDGRSSARCSCHTLTLLPARSRVFH